jgi:predicted transcriptional regulator
MSYPADMPSPFNNRQNSSRAAKQDKLAALSDVPERVRQIAMLRGLGYSYRQIAGPLDVTPQAVSLMLTRHRRSLKSLRDAMELNSLSARAVNVLGRHGIRTREQARQANVLALLAGERNCGRKTMDEIARWMEEDGEHLPVPMGKAPQGSIYAMFDPTKGRQTFPYPVPVDPRRGHRARRRRSRTAFADQFRGLAQLAQDFLRSLSARFGDKMRTRQGGAGE